MVLQHFIDLKPLKKPPYIFFGHAAPQRAPVNPGMVESVLSKRLVDFIVPALFRALACLPWSSGDR
jgi:hypothetical protein